jgi:hypothetical protein
MTEEPNLKLLNREGAKAQAQEHFTETLDLLTEQVNYGTNLIVRLLKTVEPSIVRDMAVGSLLGHAVQHLDGVSELARGGCVNSAWVQGRAALEASLSLEWMLIAEQPRRASAYKVANLRSEILWSERFVPGTPQYELMARAWQSNLPNSNPPSVSAWTAAAKERISETRERLESADLAAMNAEFQKSFKRKKYEPGWLTVLGMSAHSIAKQLNRLGEYEVFYRAGSDVVHGTTTRTRFSVGDGEMSLHPLRGPEGASNLFTFVLPLASRTYRSALNFFRPEELRNFRRKYMDEWRNRAMSIPILSESE